MNTIAPSMSRKAFPKGTTGTRQARDQIARSLAEDPRWNLLKAIDRRHMRALVAWHDPLTGYLQYRTRAINLTKLLDVTEETLRTSRWRLIDVGLIVSYVPGNGHIASTYCIARSWVEAEAAVMLRGQPDAPHFPELVDRTPSAVGNRAAPPAEDEGQAPEETPEEREEAQERYERARRRRGVTGPVPPELPSSREMDLLREIEERRADPDRLTEINDRGGAAARAAIRRVPSASGAA